MAEAKPKIIKTKAKTRNNMNTYDIENVVTTLLWK
jgi:hypothetical protein